MAGDRLLRFRPVRPAPPARDEIPGPPALRRFRPVRPVLSSVPRTRRRLHAIPRSLLERSCTGVPPDTLRVLTKNCPDRATEFGGCVTWHFMPGSLSWPYRPETQRDACLMDVRWRAVDVNRPVTSPPRQASGWHDCTQALSLPIRPEFRKFPAIEANRETARNAANSGGMWLPTRNFLALWF